MNQNIDDFIITSSTCSLWTAHCGRRNIIPNRKIKRTVNSVLSFSWAGAEIGIRKPREIKCVFHNKLYLYILQASLTINFIFLYSIV